MGDVAVSVAHFDISGYRYVRQAFTFGKPEDWWIEGSNDLKEWVRLPLAVAPEVVDQPVTPRPAPR